jgi:hypothetical protein
MIEFAREDDKHAYSSSFKLGVVDVYVSYTTKGKEAT